MFNWVTGHVSRRFCFVCNVRLVLGLRGRGGWFVTKTSNRENISAEKLFSRYGVVSDARFEVLKEWRMGGTGEYVCGVLIEVEGKEDLRHD